MLKREIKRWDLVLLIINGIIGAGIFGLPSRVFALSGVWSLLAFVVCAGVIFLFILSFAEVGSRFEKTGGPYLYTYSAFGPYPAWLLGWVMLISRLATYAALMNLFVIYLGFFLPAVSEFWPRAGVILAVTGVLFLINYKGVRESAVFSNWLAIIKMFTLIGFIVIGMYFVDGSRINFETTNFDFDGFSASVLMLVFAFTGFEATVVNTGEIKDPRKNIPFALIIGLSVITLLYIGIQWVCIGTLDDPAASDKPLATAAMQYMGSTGAAIISLGALISTAGTLHAIMLIGSRIPFALSEEGQFPRVFSWLHPEHRTPVKALFLFTAISILISVTGSFNYALSISVISKVVIFISVAAVLIRLRYKDTDASDYFKLRWGIPIAVLALVLSVWLLSSSNFSEMRDFGITLLTGMVFLVGYKWLGRDK